ncbi:MAG: hypothetical protein NTW86_10390 [Candidatus Sumerlaeota bacterium]|nr:hypothetical protein [Candidatus Sumerlaeota bacterium]
MPWIAAYVGRMQNTGIDIRRVRPGPLAFAMFATASCAFAQPAIREGDIEKVIIASASDAEAWEAEEATMAVDREKVKERDASLHFHVDVDYNAGEKEYPIGWPRASTAMAKGDSQDWGRFDFLRFWVYAETSRDKLPAEPLGIVISGADKTHKFEKNLSGLKKGEWVKMEIPLWTLPSLGKVARFQFFISESDYRDHDTVDFYFSDLCLVRYAAPHLDDLTIHPAILFSDGGAVIARFRVLGLAPDAAITAQLALVDGDRTVRHVTKSVKSGINEVILDTREANLPEGDYTVRTQLGDGLPEDRAIRVVASPWK